MIAEQAEVVALYDTKEISKEQAEKEGLPPTHVRVDLVRALLDVMDQAQPHILASCQIAQVHGCRYEGPSWHDAKAKLRELIG